MSWKDYCNKQDPFHEACASGRLEIVMQFWDGPGTQWLQEKRGFFRGVNVVSSDRVARPGWTPIFYAATGGSAEVLRFLIQQGADCLHTDRYNQSAVAYAKGNHIRQILRNEHLKSEYRTTIQDRRNDALVLILDAQSRVNAINAIDRRGHPIDSHVVSENHFESVATTFETFARISAVIIQISSDAYKLINRAEEALGKLNALKKIFFGNLNLSEEDKVEVSGHFCEFTGSAEEMISSAGLANIAKKYFSVCHVDEDFLTSLILSYDTTFAKGTLSLSEFIQSHEEFKWGSLLQAQRERVDEMLTQLTLLQLTHSERLLLMQNFKLSKGCWSRAKECHNLLTMRSRSSIPLNPLDETLLKRIEEEEERTQDRMQCVGAMTSAEEFLQLSKQLYSCLLTRNMAIDSLLSAQSALTIAKQKFRSSNSPPIPDPASLRMLFLIQTKGSSYVTDPTQLKDVLSAFGIPSERLTDEGKQYIKGNSNGRFRFSFESCQALFLEQEVASWQQNTSRKMSNLQENINLHDVIIKNIVRGEEAFVSAEQAFSNEDYQKAEKRVVDANAIFALCPRNDFKLLCSELYIRSTEANVFKHKQSAYNLLQEAHALLEQCDFEAATIAVRGAKTEYLTISMGKEAGALDSLLLRIRKAEEGSTVTVFRPTFEKFVRQGDALMASHRVEAAAGVFDECRERCQGHLARLPQSEELRVFKSLLHARLSLAFSEVGGRHGAQGGLQWHERAKEEAEQCVGLRPDWTSGHGLQAIALVALGEQKRALEATRAGLAASPPGGRARGRLMMMQLLLCAELEGM